MSATVPFFNACVNWAYGRSLLATASQQYFAYLIIWRYSFHRKGTFPHYSEMFQWINDMFKSYLGYPAWRCDSPRMSLRRFLSWRLLRMPVRSALTARGKSLPSCNKANEPSTNLTKFYRVCRPRSVRQIIGIFFIIFSIANKFFLP